VGPAVATPRLFWRRLDVMKKRLLITGLVLAALLLALYGVLFGTGD
jgi:sensor domain CHASE-containing protein